MTIAAVEKAGMAKVAPFATGLEYLTEMVNCFQAQTRLRSAERKAEGAAQPGQARARRGGVWEEEEKEDPAVSGRRLKALRAERSKAWARFEARTRQTLETGAVDIPLERIARQHGLEPMEKRIIGLTMAITLDPSLARMVDVLVPRSVSEIRTYMEILGDTTEDRIRMRRYFISSGNLATNGLITLSHCRGMMTEADFHNMDVALPRRISSMLLGEYDVEDQIAGFTSIIEPEVNLDDVALSAAKKQEALDLVSQRSRYEEKRKEWGFDDVLSYGKGTILLFSGPSGTGKTMLAHALAKATGHRLLLVDMRKALFGRSGDLEENLELLFHEARLMRAILFFDEADEMFGDRSMNGLMPTLLREFKRMDGVAILATNRKQVLDQALERRILYKLDFEPPTTEMRERIWRTHLPKAAPLASDINLAALAEEFDFVGGLIKNSVLLALNMALSRGGGDTVITQADLWAGASLQRSNQLERHTDKVNPKATLEDLALPEDVMAQVKAFVGASRSRRTVFGEWGFGKRLSCGKAISALFAGPPGVGKTMCAEAIANALGQPLYPVSLPTLVSKYVGETEKNLRRVFDEAMEAKAILLFDEADALFGQRLDESTSHAHFINGQVNALLQEMERFDGIVILATNRKESLDPAFERRLRYRIDFPMPDEAAREAIWRGLLPPEVPCEQTLDLSALARRYEFAGGAIKNVVLRAAFEAAAQKAPVTQALLERCAEAEQPLNERTVVGFK